MDFARAYSLVEIKSVDDEQRFVRGWASTPMPDRVGDIVVPEGVRAASDIPLLMHHDVRLVVGRASLGKGTSKGVPFTAGIPKVVEAGTLKDRVDEAWHSIKYGLITATSIRLKGVPGKVEPLASGGLKFMECDVWELSLTPMPMNVGAVITAIKGGGPAADEALAALFAEIKADEAIRRAALGSHGGGVVRLDPALIKTAIDPGVSGSQQRRKGCVYLK